jgi:hypothetical protein
VFDNQQDRRKQLLETYTLTDDMGYITTYRRSTAGFGGRASRDLWSPQRRDARVMVITVMTRWSNSDHQPKKGKIERIKKS